MSVIWFQVPPTAKDIRRQDLVLNSDSINLEEPWIELTTTGLHGENFINYTREDSI